MRIHPSLLLCVLAASAWVAGTAHAAQPATGEGPSSQPAVTARLVAPVSHVLLSEMRGGFDLGGGLVASFGISRAVYINGNLVANIHVSIPDVAHIDTAQATALATLVHNVTFIRNGPGNFVDPASFNRALGAIVIQNTLDNQQIRAVTSLDTTVRNLTQFNSMNLANSLQQAVVLSRGQ